jgi:hypothetical protein
MKKNPEKKPIRLATEVIRAIQATELLSVGGGRMSNPYGYNVYGCVQ